MRKTMIAATCAVLLAACSKHPAGSATLALSPSAVKNCGSGTAAVSTDVHWDATKANIPGVKIWINNQQKPASSGIFGGDDPGTLWLAGKASGTATTGKWIVAGSHIVLTESDSGDVLAEADVTALPCN
jgi:hypothetical protein